MPKFPGGSAEKLADYFVSYLFTKYTGTLHVRRIASWFGLIVLGIDKLSGQDWAIPKSRQLEFKYFDRRFKAKYNHLVKPRGGIDIVEVFPGRGSPEGKTVVSIPHLHGAEKFYNEAPAIFQTFISGGS